MKTINTLFRFIGYFFIFLYELTIANLQIAKLVLSPRLNFKSAAVKYKSKMKTPVELILITNSITLTPGTLVMDADMKTGEIWVHVMAGDNVNQICRDLNKFPENKVLWATRGLKGHD